MKQSVIRLVHAATLALVACGGSNTKNDRWVSQKGGSRWIQPAGAKQHDPIVTAVLGSQLVLATEPTKQSECAGAPTLGQLVQKELDAHPQGPVEAKCSGDAAPYQCSVYIGVASANPDPTDPQWKPTQFGVVFFADRNDGSALRSDSTVECFWQ